MKAVSTVVATLLMLMMVIALAGTAYLYISGVFTSKISTTFELIDSLNDTVTIRNSGTEPLKSITATLDGSPANIAVVPNIPGLVGYWSFNEGSGATANDNSGNGNTGTLSPSCPDCPTWTTGKSGTSLQFDGINDYVNVGNDASLNINRDLTIAFWIKAVNGNGWYPGIVSRLNSASNTGYMVNNNDDNSIGFLVGDGSQIVSAGRIYYTANEWTHITAVFEQPNLKVYVNGAIKGTATMASPIANYNNNLLIGNRYEAGIPFKGSLDEVRVYNIALNQEEVSQLYSGLVPPGQLATVKPLTSLSKGTHTLRLCSASMCNTAILTIQ